MSSVGWLKLKTRIIAREAKHFGFDRKIAGIKTIYDLNYCDDSQKQHTLDIMYPDGGEDLPCVIYFHGGGWSAYDKNVFRSTCKMLASRGAVVFNCNYRLAPEFSIEDMQDDIRSVFGFIAKTADEVRCDPDRIILAGDSAGAHLMSLFINRATLNGETQYTDRVKACVFFYGAYDLVTVESTGFEKLTAYMSSIAPYHMPDREKRLEELSPVNYICEGLPPTLICSGEIDLLHASQSGRYIEALREKGVRVDTVIFPKDETEADHRFITFDRNRAAIKSFEAFGDFIRAIGLTD